MIHSLAFFASITSAVQISVRLPNDDMEKVTHIGIVQLSSTLVLDNVLCIPSFSFNLIFISKLTQHPSCCCIFLSQYCFIQDLQPWKMIGFGRNQGGLYTLQSSLPDSLPSCVSNALSKLSPSFPTIIALNSCDVNFVDTTSLWHCRLGHPSTKRLDLLQSVVPTIISCNNKNFDCSICPLAKQKRLSFPISTSHSSACFDLIHVDIWGPYSTPSLNGSRYFLTLLDDYSRCTWVFLMKYK